MNEEYKVVKLGNGTKWFVISEINYENGIYRYVVQLDTNDEATNIFKVMRVFHKEGKELFGFIEVKELLKKIIPLLVPDAKEYIEHPEKLNELTD